MVMSRGAGNGRGFNGDHGSSLRRYEVQIPGFERTKREQLIPQPDIVLRNGIGLQRSPHRRIVTVYEAVIHEYEFEIAYEQGHYVARSPQLSEWTYRFPLLTPVSEYWITLEIASLMWEIDADAADGFDDWFTSGLPQTSGDGDLGEGNGLVSGVDY